MQDAVCYGMGVVGKATAKALSIPHYFDKTGANIGMKTIKIGIMKMVSVYMLTNTRL